MWIFTSNTFVSIVEHFDDPDVLIVRGRFRGDVDRFLGARRETETPEADYRFRAHASRPEVERALQKAVRQIAYGNFKGSIRVQWRKAVAMRVWSIVEAAQRQGLGR